MLQQLVLLSFGPSKDHRVSNGLDFLTFFAGSGSGYVYGYVYGYVCGYVCGYSCVSANFSTQACFMGRELHRLRLVSWGGELFDSGLFHGEESFSTQACFMGRELHRLRLVSWGGELLQLRFISRGENFIDSGSFDDETLLLFQPSLCVCVCVVCVC